MKPVPLRVQLFLVAAGYAVVLAISALLILWRYMQYVRNPQDVAASGGMWAGGDLLLELFILFLFLIPTVALVFVIRKSEPASVAYAKALFGLSLTAPVSLGLMSVPVPNQWSWGFVIIFRLFAIPIVIVVLIFSRWMARFALARRLLSYALLIEVLTLLVIVGLFLFPAIRR